MIEERELWPGSDWRPGRVRMLEGMLEELTQDMRVFSKSRGVTSACACTGTCSVMKGALAWAVLVVWTVQKPKPLPSRRMHRHSVQRFMYRCRFDARDHQDNVVFSF